jgi:hypothetical protein
VLGADGQRIISRSVEALADSNLPDRTNHVRFESAAAMHEANVNPLNKFTVRLDFTEPPSFNVYNPWEQRTPNQSDIEVDGKMKRG